MFEPFVERVVGVDVKESKFSGTLVLQYVEASYANQNGDLVARALDTQVQLMRALGGGFVDTTTPH